MLRGIQARDAAIGRDVDRNDQRPVRNERVRHGRGHGAVSQQARRLGQALRGDAHRAFRQAPCGQTPQWQASGLRCIAHDVARAECVRPGEAGRAYRGDGVAQACHSTRSRCRRSARRRAAARTARARHRQPLLHGLSARRDRRDVACALSKPADLAAVDGARARRRDTGHQQGLYPGQSLSCRPPRAAGDQGRVARAQRAATSRRFGAAAGIPGAVQGSGPQRRRRLAGAQHRCAGSCDRGDATPAGRRPLLQCRRAPHSTANRGRFGSCASPSPMVPATSAALQESAQRFVAANPYALEMAQPAPLSAATASAPGAGGLPQLDPMLALGSLCRPRSRRSIAGSTSTPAGIFVATQDGTAGRAASRAAAQSHSVHSRGDCGQDRQLRPTRSRWT